MSGPICFLSDFGLEDGYVGVVKGVILSVEPSLQVVDLSHAVPPQDVRAGAFLLMTAIPYFPPGTVYLAVVDPGVGTARPAIAVEAGGYRFVGPDNGLLSWALRRLARTADAVVEDARGEPEARPADRSENRPADRLRLRPGAAAVSLAEPRFWRPSVSATFHGRDVFGPVAAHLAAGVPLAQVGPPIEAILALPFPMPIRARSGVRGEVVHVDRFGNLITNLAAGDVPPDAALAVGGRTIHGLAPHFQQPAELIALIGSSGLLEVAVPNGSAAALLRLGVGAEVLVRPPAALHPTS